jgi:predicted secreted hydrolase
MTQPIAHHLLIPAVLLLLLSACGSSQPAQIQGSLSAVESLSSENRAGFARATTPRPFVFPRDHGPHPDYQIEWWYYTGNLHDAAGNRYGYQLTFFRSGLSPQPPDRSSDWATRNIYMAHFALSDIAGETFSAYDRFSRDGADLAGASGEPYRVFLEDWSAEGSGPEGMRMHLTASVDDIAIDLMLESTKPPTLQGERGLSQKGSVAGNASYYYSLTRMRTEGSIRIQDKTIAVQGASWMDHEFSTSALEENARGWDWFSLQLDNGYDIMLWQIRQTDETERTTTAATPLADGMLTLPDGSTRRLAAQDFTLDVLDTWQSPHTGKTYPTHWRLTLPSEDTVLDVQALLADQELRLAVVYWEGAVQLRGTSGGQPVSGYGYVELTGY